jgi:hypothetical protein
MKDLEVRKITIDDKYSDGEDLGMENIAYTSKPAIMIKGMAFSSNQSKEFKFRDELKMRIAAPIMVPGQIYRNDTEEYFVEFTEDVIEKIYQKFMSNLNGKPVFNLEHVSEDIAPSYILEAILVDSENKMKFIKDEYKIDLPKGSVFIVSQITDEKYYNYLVENDKLGFSIEGFLGLEFTEQFKNKKIEMEKQKFALPDGEWMMDGKTYIVKDGEVIDIKEEVKLEDAPKEDIKEDIKEEVKEEVKLEDAPKEDIKEEVKEEVKLEDAPVVENTPAVEPSMEETIIKVVDERIEVLINEIADLKSQLLDMKNNGEEVEVEMKKQGFTAAEKALGLFKFASNL